MQSPARASALALAVILSLTLPFASLARAQSTEERFQDLFVTAGYTTAFE